MRVPADLADSLGKAEVWKALGTADLKEAKRLAPRALANLHDEWAAARASLDAVSRDEEPSLDADLQAWRQPLDGQTEAESLLSAWLRRELVREWAYCHSGVLTNAPALRELVDDIDSSDNGHARATYYAVELAEQELEGLLADHRRGDYRRAYSAVREVVGHLRRRVREGDQHFAALAMQLMDAMSLVATARQHWAEGNVSYSPIWSPNLPAGLFQAPARPATPTVGPEAGNPAEEAVPASETLRALAERYFVERARSVSVEWLKSQKTIVRLFLEDVGDTIPARSVNKKMAREWKARLMLFPSRGTIRGEKLLFPQIVERNAIEGLPTLTTRTINKYLSGMRSLFDWLNRHDHVGHTEQNPFDGLGIDEGDSEGARDPFTHDQLQALFLSPLFCGCLSGDGPGLATQGKLMIRDWRFWLPLLGLYTGARPGELAQLTPADISSRDGSSFISISASGGRKVKTRNARRAIPVHATLINIGFLKMVEHARLTGQTRIFPLIKPDSLGRYSSMPNDVLNPYLKRIGIKTNARTCLYSLRHNFMDGLRDAGYSDAEFAPLVGHGTAGPKVTSGYGSGSSLPIQRRVAMISGLCFGDLDLSHLHD